MPGIERLHVEGINDFHVVRNLLLGFGLRIEDQDIKKHDGVDALLNNASNIVRLADRSIGIIVDADLESGVARRWQSLRGKLGGLVDLPEDPDPNGYVGIYEKTETLVGVWVMPDNVSDGTLEDFLVNLIPDGTMLFEYACTSTTKAREHGAGFKEVHGRKAEIYTWLAWQEEPGKPYGQAVTAGYFRKDAELAERFKVWAVRVFPDLAPLATAPANPANP